MLPTTDIPIELQDETPSEVEVLSPYMFEGPTLASVRIKRRPVESSGMWSTLAIVAGALLVMLGGMALGVLAVLLTGLRTIG